MTSPAPAPVTAVLLPSCPRYAAAAELTAGLISRYWSAHPPIFCCGLTGQPSWGGLLRSTALPHDWLGLLRDAVRALEQRGCEFLYLILDDHSPIGPCNDNVLNAVLPQFLSEEGYDSLCLYGAGQGDSASGEILNAVGGRFEVLPPDCPWIFALHPGLWRTRFLMSSLDELAAGLGTRSVSAWEFEQLMAEAIGRGDLRTGRHLRLWGSSLAARQHHLPLQMLLQPLRLAGRGLSRTMLSAGWPRAAAGMQRRFHPLNKYFHGPYPYYWSGLLLRGRIQNDLLTFLRINGKWQLAREIAALHCPESKAHKP